MRLIVPKQDEVIVAVPNAAVFFGRAGAGIELRVSYVPFGDKLEHNYSVSYRVVGTEEFSEMELHEYLHDLGEWLFGADNIFMENDYLWVALREEQASEDGRFVTNVVLDLWYNIIGA